MKWRFYLMGLLLFGCHQRPDSEHLQYVHQAFDSIRVYSVRQEFNFDSLENDVVSQLKGDQNMEAIHELLHVAVITIDRHSFLVTPDENIAMMEGGEDAVPEPFPFSGKILNGKYAYVDVLPFSGIDSVSVDNYTDSLQRLLLSHYKKGPTGWIIDLRTNSGGNPYAMVGGLGALLGEGTLVSSISVDGGTHDHFYIRRDTLGEIEKLELIDSAYVFEEELPISVLVGPETGSAAEVLTLAFKGLKHAMVLGQPTFGVPTGLQPVYLSDSACMFITNSIDHDRFGNAYDGPIEPDEVIEDPMKLFERSYQFIDGWPLD